MIKHATNLNFLSKLNLNWNTPNQKPNMVEILSSRSKVRKKKEKNLCKNGIQSRDQRHRNYMYT